MLFLKPGLRMHDVEAYPPKNSIRLLKKLVLKFVCAIFLKRKIKLYIFKTLREKQQRKHPPNEILHKFHNHSVRLNPIFISASFLCIFHWNTLVGIFVNGKMFRLIFLGKWIHPTKNILLQIVADQYLYVKIFTRR